jgi:hypothetical protein
MTVRQAFMGLLQLFVVLFFLGAGVLLIGLRFAPGLALTLENALLTKPDLFALVGFVLIGLSLMLVLGFLSVNRGRTLLLRMGASIDVLLIRQTIAPLLQRQFADRIALSDVRILRGKELTIGLRLAPMNPDEREKLLLQAERHLQILLMERFGISQPFMVQASI